MSSAAPKRPSTRSQPSAPSGHCEADRATQPDLLIPGAFISALQANGRVQTSALLALAEIWRWHLQALDGTEPAPTAELERLGDAVWRTNYRYFQNQFGLSRRTGERSLGILCSIGLIKRTIRHAEFEGRTLPNSIIVDLRVEEVHAMPGMSAAVSETPIPRHHDKMLTSEPPPNAQAESSRPDFGTAPREAIAAFLQRNYSGRRGRDVIPWQLLLDQDCPISFDAQKAQAAFEEEYEACTDQSYQVELVDQIMDRRAAVRLDRLLRRHPANTNALRRSARDYLGGRWDGFLKGPRPDNLPFDTSGYAGSGFRFSDFLAHVEAHGVPKVPGRSR